MIENSEIVSTYLVLGLTILIIVSMSLFIYNRDYNVCKYGYYNLDTNATSKTIFFSCSGFEIGFEHRGNSYFTQRGLLFK